MVLVELHFRGYGRVISACQAPRRCAAMRRQALDHGRVETTNAARQTGVETRHAGKKSQSKRQDQGTNSVGPTATLQINVRRSCSSRWGWHVWRPKPVSLLPLAEFQVRCMGNLAEGNMAMPLSCSSRETRGEM